MMAVYEYTAQDENGAILSGTYGEIDGVATLREELTKVGYTVLRAKRQKFAKKNNRKINQNEIVAFVYKFAGMCAAGLSIVRCLETLEQQSENHAFKYVLSDIRKHVEQGSTLKEAFEKYRNIFSDFFVAMLEAGESGGKLSDTLEMSANYLEKHVDLKRKLKSAFIYPIVVGSTCLVIITFLLIYVIPVFSKMYQQMGAPLPVPTLALVNLSLLIRNWWWAVLLIIAGVLMLLKVFLKTPYLKAKWDTFKLNMPVFAKLNRMVAASRFIGTFAMLASTGVSFIKAFDIAGLVVNNAKVSEITRQLQQSVKTGNDVAGSLKNYDIFPPMIVQLAAAGEESGMLSEMLNKGVHFLNKDIDRMINALLVKLEPALTIFMGLIVGFILVAVYLPLFDYMAYFK